jgi:hypothetical protein
MATALHGALPVQAITPPLEDLEREDRLDFLSKALAVCQVTYLIVQLVVRAVYQLPSSQLEIAALAFASCSLLTFLLYWRCPQGVQTVRVFPAQRLVCSKRLFLLDLAEAGPRYLWLSRRTAAQATTDAHAHAHHHPHPHDPLSFSGPAIPAIPAIPNDASPLCGNVPGSRAVGRNNELLCLASGALVGGTLFGGLHALAWRFSFPTPLEAALWRACCVVTAALPLVAVAPLALWLRLNPSRRAAAGSGGARGRTAGVAVGVCAVPYLLARLFLLVEALRSLACLPPEAFVDTWADVFPNWG